MKTVLRLFCVLCLICILSEPAEALVPERRRPQFQTESGYYIFPAPYSLPGIGDGLAIVGVAMNIANTYTDVAGAATSGDVKGYGIGAKDFHLIPRALILDGGYSSYSSATIRSYSQRGMNTDKNDYTLLEFGDINSYGGRLTATFFDRRFEVYGWNYGGSSKLERVRKRDGEIIIDTENPPKGRFQSRAVGVFFDFTDDYSDPRKGLRQDVTRSWSPPEDFGPDFYVMSYNTTAYVPIGRRSTWVFNYSRSDAVVVKKGETDRAALAQKQGLDCDSITDPDLKQQCEQVLDSIIAANTYGTVSSLGGTSRLRSYPEGRYRGAHSQFYGTELRWNLTDEFTPFNIYIMKDIRTSFQIALFYEIGSVADKRSELDEIMRSSYGLGLRMVTASGFVFRADAAEGNEGAAVTIIFGYPWEF